MTEKKEQKPPPDTAVKAVKAVDQTVEESKVSKDTVTLSTGVVLKFKQIPPGMMIKVLAKTKKPEVPKYYVEAEKMWFSNPDDPEYIKQMEFYELESAGFLLNVMILLGTDIVSHPNVKGPNSNGWLEDFEALGLDILEKNKSWRKLNWLLKVAAETDKDFEAITKGVGELSGVPEENVAEAAKFPGRNEDGGDSGSA